MSYPIHSSAYSSKDPVSLQASHAEFFEAKLDAQLNQNMPNIARAFRPQPATRMDTNLSGATILNSSRSTTYEATHTPQTNSKTSKTPTWLNIATGGLFLLLSLPFALGFGLAFGQNKK